MLKMPGNWWEPVVETPVDDCALGVFYSSEMK